MRLDDAVIGQRHCSSPKDSLLRICNTLREKPIRLVSPTQRPRSTKSGFYFQILKCNLNCFLCSRARQSMKRSPPMTKTLRIGVGDSGAVSSRGHGRSRKTRLPETLPKELANGRARAAGEA